MSIDAKAFITIIRRALKSKYKIFLLHNHMLMQSYNLTDDNVIGFHYVLHIPYTEEYDNDLYNSTLILDAEKLLLLYKTGHDILLEKKKAISAKPKDVKEIIEFITNKNHAKIKFQFIVCDELIYTSTYTTKYPIDEYDENVVNIVSSYQNILNRIKVGSSSVSIDCIKAGILYRLSEATSLIYHKIKIYDKKIMIPVLKSMLAGINKPDEFFMSIQETTIQNVYLYTIQLSANSITDQYIGYIQNFV